MDKYAAIHLQFAAIQPVIHRFLRVFACKEENSTNDDFRPIQEIRGQLKLAQYPKPNISLTQTRVKNIYR